MIDHQRWLSCENSTAYMHLLYIFVTKVIFTIIGIELNHNDLVLRKFYTKITKLIVKTTKHRPLK